MASQQKRVVVILNRRARRLADPAGSLSRALCSPRSGVHVLPSHSLEELAASARRLVRDLPDAIVFAGGDGSYMAGITALDTALREVGLSSEALPPIGLAPGGTVSTVARNWGFRGGGLTGAGEDHADFASRLLQAARSGAGSVLARPTLRVRDDSTSRVGFIFGAGLVSRFFEIYDARGAGGYRSALALVARIFAGSLGRGTLAKHVLTPAPCTIAVDDVDAAFERVSLVAASVVRDLGLGMRLLYRAGETTERFHVVASELGPSRLGPQLPRVLLGRPLRGDKRVDALARVLRLRFPEGEGSYVLDGELLRTQHVEVSAGPVLRILLPVQRTP